MDEGRRGVGRALVKLTVGITFLLTALACPSPVMAAGALLLSEDSLKLLMTAISNVSAGNVANAIDATIDALTPGKDSDRISLENEHLTRAVGKAISAVIILAAKPYQGETHSNLMKIAAYAQDNWVKIAQQELTQEHYPQLREANLDQFLTPDEYKLTQDGNLLSEDWEAIFRRLTIATCPEDRIVINDRVRKEVAELLHTTFPKALRETLKEDFAKDGKAFAGLTLQLLTGTKAELEKLQENQQESFQSVLNHIQELETQLKGTDEQQQAVFTEISQQINSGFAEVCQKLGVMETTITGLLENLKNYLEAKFEELGEELKEHKSILLQLLSNNPQIAKILGRSKERLEKIRQQLETVILYKEIHDLLFHDLFYLHQTIQIKIDHIQINSNLYNKTKEIETIVDYEERTFTKIVVTVKEIEYQCKKLPYQPSWLPNLTDVRTKIDEPCQQSKSKILVEVISQIKKLLSRIPGRINDMIKLAASQLSLMELGEIIENLLQEDQAHTNISREEENKLRTAIDEIKDLKPRLDSLIENHNKWQNIEDNISDFYDGYLRILVVAKPHQSWDEIRGLWDEIRGLWLELQQKICCQEQSIIKRSEKIHEIFNQEEINMKELKKLLNDYCDLCHDHFDNVDRNLINFCDDELKPLHRDLENLLKLNNRGV